MTDERPIAVVGAGTMGREIALTLALGGYYVRLHDNSRQALKKAKDGLTPLSEGLVRRGLVGQEHAQAAIERVSPVADLADAVEAVLIVVESVPEDIDLKLALFGELDVLVPSDAVLASNTSSLSITRMAAATANPSRVVGMHFFNPATRMQMVEIVRGLLTDDATVERAQQVCDLAARRSIVVADRPGFASSRLSAAFGNEAFHMFMEGVATPEEIDIAAKLALGHPMGPFELGDLIGLDTRLRVLKHLHATLGERFRPCPLLVTYVESGRLGRKTGRGVYDYDVSETVEVDRG